MSTPTSSPLLADVYAYRRENLRYIRDTTGGPTKLALRLGHANGSFISQIIGLKPRREISEAMAREIEAKLELQPGALDKPPARAIRDPLAVLRTPPPEPGTVGNPIGGGVAPAVDPRLLADVLCAVTEATQGRITSIAKIASLSSLAYTHSARAGGVVDRGYIDNLAGLLQ